MNVKQRPQSEFTSEFTSESECRARQVVGALVAQALDDLDERRLTVSEALQLVAASAWDAALDAPTDSIDAVAVDPTGPRADDAGCAVG
jgi:hypothetical protein